MYTGNTYRGVIVGMLLLPVFLFAIEGNADQSGATDEQWNISLLLQNPGIGDFDVYQYGFGAELQYRRWYGFTGMALSIGAEQWEPKRRSSDWGTTRSSHLRGDLTLIPVGASMIGRWPIREGLILRGEAGLRYVWLDSDVRIRMPEWAHPEPVSIRDTWIVLAGVGVEQLLTESIMLFGGVRYQYDPIRSSAKAGDVSLMDHRLHSFGLQVGVQYWY